MGLLDIIRQRLGYAAPQQNVFTNRVSPERQSRFYSQQEDPRRAFRRGLTEPVTRTYGHVKEVPRGLATILAQPVINRAQRDIDTRNEEARQLVIKRARQTPDPAKRQKLFQIAQRIETPNVQTEVNPRITEPGYAKEVGGTFFDVGTAIAAPAVALPKALEGFAAKSALAKLASYGLTRGAEGMAYQAGRDISTGEGFSPTRTVNAGLFGALANTALSPRLTARAGSEVVGNVKKSLTIDPQTGKLVASPGFAKVPGEEAVAATTPETSKLRSRINTATPTGRVAVGKGWDDIKQTMINRFDPIEQLVKGKDLKPTENPATLIKRFSGGMGIANAKLDYELSPILRGKEDQLDDLRSLMVAERLTEKAGQGIGKAETGVIRELQNKYGSGFAQLQDTAAQLRTYQNKLLREWHSVGGLSDESLRAIETANQKYVPMNRVIDDLEKDGFIAGVSNLNQKSQIIKRFKGSERDIVDPLESIVRNTYDMTKAIEKNRALTALADVGEFRQIPGAGGLFEPKTPHITLFRNGKKIFYEAPKEIADAIKGIDEEHLNLAVRAMALPARIMRAGATSMNVGFAVPNVVRDQLSATINSKYGGVPVYDFFSGLASVFKQDEAYKKWLLSGADQAAFFSQERTTLQKTLPEIIKGRTATLGRVIKNPLELLRKIGEFSEKGTRLGVFKRALAGAQKRGLTGQDALLDAMVESREATIDFARRGSKMKSLNAIIPFLNARLQGTTKLLESFRKRPAQSGAIGLGLVSIPAITAYFHNRRYPEFEEIPDYIKENNFIIMTGGQDTPFIKIPKGEVGQIFSNPIENFLGYLYDTDRSGFFKMAQGVLGQLSPVSSIGDIIPTAAKVPLESIANYDTFRKRNIVSPYKKDLPPELQFDDKTSETAKVIGSWLKQSPAKVEHIIRGLGAGVAGDALLALDYGVFGKEPETQNLPVINRFLGEPKDLSKSAQRIYENEDKRKQGVARTNYAIKQRIRKAIETNNTDLLEEAYRADPENFKRFSQDVLNDIEGESLSPKERAIRSLPKKEQERLGLAPLSTTGQPTAGAASGDVVELLKQLTAKESEKNDPQQINDIKLRRLKDSGDLAGWTNLAQQQLKLYGELLLDPSLTELERLQIEEKKRSLLNNAIKYKGYGGFTKPKKGRKGRRIKISASTAPKIKSIKFKPTIPKPATKSISISSLPRAKATSNSQLRAVRGRKIKIIK